MIKKLVIFVFLLFFGISFVNAVTLEDSFITDQTKVTAVTSLTNIFQGFTTTSNYHLSEVELNLLNVGGTATGDIYAEIYSESADLPNSLLGTSNSVSINTISSSKSFINFDGLNLDLVSGTKYIIKTKTTSISGSVDVYGSSNTAYSGGRGGYDSGTDLLFAIQHDLNFKTYSSNITISPILNFTNITLNDETLINNSFSNLTSNIFETFVLNTSTNTNVNTSLFINGILNQTNVSGLNSTFYVDFVEGIYNASFYTQNNETNATSDNFTITVDTTPPVISVIGNVTVDSYFVNFSTIFAVNYSISGEKSCTLNITYLSANESDSNFFIGCGDTQLFTRAGDYNGFLTAEDNAGNIVTGSVNGTIDPVINIFFTQTNSSIVLNYTPTLFHPDGRITFPEVQPDGSIQLSPVNNGSLDLGTHIIQFERLGFVTQNFSQIVNATNAGTNTTFNVSEASIIVNIFDRTTSAVLNVSTTVTIFGLGNITTSTGQAVFQDFNFLPGDYSVEAVSTGFYTEQQQFTYSGESNATINLYLLDFSQNNSATLIVPTTDEWDNVLTGVDVRLQEYDTTIFGFKEVSQCTSNSNGECQFLVEQSTKSYRIVGTITINGISYTATNPENDNDGETFLPIISGGEEVLGQEIIRQLRLKISDTLRPANFIGLTITSPNTKDDTIVSENATDTIINVPVSFLADSGLSYTVCFELYAITGNSFNEVITPVCTTGASGLLPTVDITLNNDFDYQARITVQFDGGSKELYQTYIYPNNKTFGQILSNKALVPNMVMFFWTILLAVSLYLRNLGLWSWGAMFLAVIQIGLFANILVASSSVIIIVVNIVVLQVSKRQVDLQ